MFGKKMVVDMITRSAENESDRRNFLRAAGITSLGVVGGAGILGSSSPMAEAQTNGPSDVAVLNFALNLEYLEAEFYSRAFYGYGLDPSLTDGCGTRGGVIGGRQVSFSSRAIRDYAREIANDEIAHVKFLRAALGTARVARPQIDLKSSFTAAARAAGLIGAGKTFDPYANENNFLLAAFIFEDVGVTAYKGAAPLISNKTFLEAAAGLLAVEAYHAAIVRTTLYSKDLTKEVRKISAARDSLDGSTDLDQGIRRNGRANLVPTDGNGLAYSRSAAQVLNIVYLTPEATDRGGFFPRSINGDIRMSGDNG